MCISFEIGLFVSEIQFITFVVKRKLLIYETAGDSAAFTLLCPPKIPRGTSSADGYRRASAEGLNLCKEFDKPKADAYNGLVLWDNI